MMMSLFSVFDPISFLGVSLNWFSLFFVFFFMILVFGVVVGRYEEISFGLIVSFFWVFKEIGGEKWKVLSYMSLVVFFFLGVVNFMGLWSFVFASTSHLMVTMGLGVVLWLSFFLMGWLGNFEESSAHLVPEGSPMILAPFMVMIESVSHVIRPVTLSVRLAANIMAGHLIVSLVSWMSMGGGMMMVVSVLFQSMVMVLELGVVFIQAFVFGVLILLYALEYY